MPEAFDAYYKWLGIPPNEQPPSCYRLLSIALFESDPDVITNAADKQMAHIRSFQTGQHSALSQKLLNEIATARICLLNAAKKARYDGKLRWQMTALESQPQQAEAIDTSKIGLDFSATKAAPVVKRPRTSHGTKLPWQLPAAIGAAILASVAIIAYLFSNTPKAKNLRRRPRLMRRRNKATKEHCQSQERKCRQTLKSKPEAKPEVKPERESLNPSHHNLNQNPSRSLKLLLKLLKRLRSVSKTPSPRPKPPLISGLSQSMP